MTVAAAFLGVAGASEGFVDTAEFDGATAAMAIPRRTNSAVGCRPLPPLGS